MPASGKTPQRSLPYALPADEYTPTADLQKLAEGLDLDPLTKVRGVNVDTTLAAGDVVVVTGGEPTLTLPDPTVSTKAVCTVYVHPQAVTASAFPPAAVSEDKFNRANENPLSNAGKWEQWTSTGGAEGKGQVTSNAWHAKSAGGGACALWNVTKQANMGVVVEFASVALMEGIIFLYAEKGEKIGSGVALSLVREGAGKYEFRLGVGKNQTSSTFESALTAKRTKVTLEDGDSVAVTERGAVLTAWKKHAGVWTKVLEGSARSAGYPEYTEGYAAFYMVPGSTGVIDNFEVFTSPVPSKAKIKVAGGYSVWTDYDLKSTLTIDAGERYILAAGKEGPTPRYLTIGQGRSAPTASYTQLKEFVKDPALTAEAEPSATRPAHVMATMTSGLGGTNVCTIKVGAVEVYKGIATQEADVVCFMVPPGKKWKFERTLNEGGCSASTIIL